MAFLDKLKAGLAKTKSAFMGQVDNVIRSFVKIDEDLFDELEELLISADIGVNTTEEILDQLRDEVKENRLKESAEVKTKLFEILKDMIGEHEPLNLSTKPSVILVIGVNGAGKTTLIKLLTRLYDPTEGRILLDGKDLKEYDYIYYMDSYNQRRLGRMFPDYDRFLPFLDRDVADPWYTGDFEQTYQDVLAGCKGLLDELE